MVIGRMKTFVVAVVSLFLVLALWSADLLAAPTTLNGAGASFPAPIYMKWAYKYESLHGVRINYQSIGSGGGIRQIKAGTVDFGASDAPLTKKELDEAGLVQFPMLMGGVVPIVNVQGINAGDIKLPSDVLVRIFMGEVTKWNHPAIRNANEDLRLPDLDITVVRRADGSGTTWIFTNYLSKVSAEWEEEIGSGKSVDWPTGIGAKGNEGVSTKVDQVNGAIGYVEYSYAVLKKLAHIRLKNKAGNYVEPTAEAFQAAAANAEWKKAPGFYMVLTDQPGEKSWPITGATFILLYKKQQDRDTAKAMLDYFDWCYDHGDKMAEELHYVPMPDNVVKLVQQEWSEDLRVNGAKIWQ